MPAPYTTQTFTRRAIEIHGEHKFNYTLVKYVDSRTNIDVICMRCGKTMSVRPDNHLRTDKGCRKCDSPMTASQEEFLKKAKDVHGNKYCYGKYRSARDIIRINCNTCGLDFEQIAYNHLAGHGCSNCVKKVRMDTDMFKQKMIRHRLAGSFSYAHDLVVVSGNREVELTCIYCDTTQLVKPNDFFALKSNHCRVCADANAVHSTVLKKLYKAKYCNDTSVDVTEELEKLIKLPIQYRDIPNSLI